MVSIIVGTLVVGTLVVGTLVGILGVVMVAMRMNIIVRITVIWDQDTACVIAGKFDLAWIYLVYRNDVTLAIDLDYSFMWRHSSSCNFRINVACSLDMATCGNKVHAVRAQRLILAMLSILSVGAVMFIAA